MKRNAKQKKLAVILSVACTVVLSLFIVTTTQIHESRIAHGIGFPFSYLTVYAETEQSSTFDLLFRANKGVSVTLSALIANLILYFVVAYGILLLIHKVKHRNEPISEEEIARKNSPKYHNKKLAFLLSGGVLVLTSFFIVQSKGMHEGFHLYYGGFPMKFLGYLTENPSNTIPQALFSGFQGFSVDIIGLVVDYALFFIVIYGVLSIIQSHEDKKTRVELIQSLEEDYRARQANRTAATDTE